MKRSLVVASMVALGASFCADSAFAGRWNRCCAPKAKCCTAAPACAAAPACTAAPGCAPAPATTAPQPEAAPPTPQASNSNGYQSFSYEPGAVVPPAPVAAPVPAVRYAPARPARTSQDLFIESIRGDKKMRGH